MIRGFILAAAAFCALAASGCGTRTAATASAPARATATSTSAATPQPVATPTRSEPKQHRRRPALTPCDANIEVKAATTTCAFAQNVFFEYWSATQSGDGASIEAYSPAAKRTY